MSTALCGIVGRSVIMRVTCGPFNIEKCGFSLVRTEHDEIKPTWMAGL